MDKRLLPVIIVFLFSRLVCLGADIYLSGSINDQFPVFMYLHVQDSEIKGWYYYYQSAGGKTELTGQWGNEELITLNEQEQDGKSSGSFTGKLAEGVFKGKWQNAATSYNFTLTNIAETMTSSLDKGKGLRSDYKFPFFTASSHLLAVNKDIFNFIMDRVAAFTDYCYEFYFEDEVIAVPWSSELSYQIEYYDDSFISILFSCYEYLGGAHGSSYSFVKNYRLTPSGFKTFELRDLINAGPESGAALSALIIEDLKRQQASLVVEGEIHYFQPDDLKTFTLSHGGITFHFAPYEVGSYAEGPFTVFLPFEQLKPLFKKETAALLKLVPAGDADSP